MVNDAGGLNGHQVKLFTEDDGGDPARSKANVKALVERRGIVALLADFSLITRGGHSQYLLDKKIPVLGGEAATPEWTQNPVYFSVVSGAEVEMYGVLDDIGAMGKTKLAYLYCAEAQGCRDGLGWIEKYAPERGVKLVYSRQISVAQPDYTAECLQARNSGADVVFFAGDDSTIARAAGSCARQQYQPLFLSLNAMQTDRMARSPSLSGAGLTMYGNQPLFPWFLTIGTPGIVEFATMLRRYRQGVGVDGATAIGWTSGKLLEAALRREFGPITSAAIMRGLWTITDETLGGLIAPVTFIEGKPTPQGRCWFPTAIEDGQWTAPKGPTPRCADRTF